MIQSDILSSAVLGKGGFSTVVLAKNKLNFVQAFKITRFPQVLENGDSSDIIDKEQVMNEYNVLSEFSGYNHFVKVYSCAVLMDAVVLELQPCSCKIVDALEAFGIENRMRAFIFSCHRYSLL